MTALNIRTGNTKGENEMTALNIRIHLSQDYRGKDLDDMIPEVVSDLTTALTSLAAEGLAPEDTMDPLTYTKGPVTITVETVLDMNRNVS